MTYLVTEWWNIDWLRQPDLAINLLTRINFFIYKKTESV